MGIHGKLVKNGVSWRYLGDVGDRKYGVIQNSYVHRSDSGREEDVQGQDIRGVKYISEISKENLISLILGSGDGVPGWYTQKG